MMANINFWPNCRYEFNNILIISAMLPINKPRTKAILRVGPHNKEVLELIICGMLGDFWADQSPGKILKSTRFQIEQSISNAAYIHYLTLYFYNLGYCAHPIPALIKKADFNKSALVSKHSENLSVIATNENRNEIKKESEKVEYLNKNKYVENRFNYRLALFSFTSLN